MSVQVLLLMQTENEYFAALHLTGMKAGSNGHNAFWQNMSRYVFAFLKP